MGKMLLLVGLVSLATGAAYAQGIIVEAETFTAYHNEGGNSIMWIDCSAASGGRAVEGLDYPGDWIEVTLAIENGSFTDRIRSAGLVDLTSSIRSTVFGAGPGDVDLTSVFTTYGLGIG